MNAKEKEAIKEILNSYVDDLKAERRPEELFNFCKENSDLAKEIAPLYHIIRLKWIAEGNMDDKSIDPNKLSIIRDDMVNEIKDYREKQKQKEKSAESMKGINFRPAVAFRKNEKDKDDEEKEDYTAQAIERMRKKMKKFDND